LSLGRIFQLVVVVTAIAAGLGYFSFFWTLIPVFVAGSLAVSNGPGFDVVIQANQDGRLGVMPLMILRRMLPWLAVAGIVYWIARALNSN
jgi:hypothetical protein